MLKIVGFVKFVGFEQKKLFSIFNIWIVYWYRCYYK